MPEARFAVVLHHRREANSNVPNPRGGYVVRSYPLSGEYRSAEAVKTYFSLGAANAYADRLNRVESGLAGSGVSAG